MQTEIFKRIFWKEYQQYRFVCLGFLAIALLFQLLVFILPFYLFQQNRQEWLFTCAAVFTSVYVIAIGAAMFAGERENRTADWLVLLSPNPIPVLSAKILFAISSAFAISISLQASSLLLAPSVQVLSVVPANFFVRQAPLLLLVPSILGSLLSRRIFAAVATMIALWIFGIFIPLNLIMVSFHVDMTFWVGRVIVMVFAVAAIAEAWIGWRWCKGKFLDGEFLEMLQAKLSATLKLPTRKQHKRSRLPSAVEYDQQESRIWQRLMWQERHRESLLPFQMIGLSVFVLILAGRVHHDFSVLAHLTVVLVMIIPLFAGIAGFEWNAGTAQVQFLRNRGVSTRALWCSKHLLWIFRAYWMTAVVIGIAYLMELVLYAPESRTVNFRLEQRTVWTQILGNQGAGIGLACWYVLMSYCCGQLAALTCRSIVFAGLLAAVFNLTAIVWVLISDDQNSARYLSIGIPCVLMLLISYFRMKTRVNSSDSPARWLSQNLKSLRLARE